MMRERLWLWAMLGLILFTGAAAAQTPTRVRGTIDQLSGNVLTVTTKSGDKVAITLADAPRVLAMAKASLADITPGRSVGVASLPQPDGTLRALEVMVLPVGEKITPVNGDWDLAPSSRMTNGAIEGAVAAADGATLTVNYGKGEAKIVVPPGAPIVTPTPGDRAMLTPGAHVVVFARKAENGTFSGGAVAVGKDGLVPPM